MKLTEDQLELKRLAHDFAEREIAPRAQAGDKEGEIPAELLAKVQELGLINLRIPESMGGLGLTNFDAVVITEEFATACSGIASATETSEIALTPILVFGQESQKKALLPDLAAQGALLGMALGTDLLIAESKNGSIFLNGKCEWVSNVTMGEKIFVRFSLAGKTEIFGVYVSAKAEGNSAVLKPNILGRKAQNIGSLTFSNVAVKEDDVFSLGKDVNGYESRLARHNFPIEAALAVGIANAALTNAITYSKERKTFGKEIFQHQAVSFMLADMKKDITAARLLVWQAAKAADHGFDLPNLYLSAKTYAQDMAVGVATDAVQIYGGYGYSREYPVEKLMRDAKTLDLPFNPAYELKAGLGRLLLA